MANRHSDNVPVPATGPSPTPTVTNGLSLPGAWPYEPADPAVTACTPPLAAHSPPGPAVSKHRRRPGVVDPKNPIITHRQRMPNLGDTSVPAPVSSSSYEAQNSETGPVEINTLSSTPSRRSVCSRHPDLPPSPRATYTKTVKANKKLRNKSSYLSQASSDVRAPYSAAQTGPWAKAEVEQLQRSLEAFYQEQLEGEKQAAALTPISKKGKLATTPDSQQPLYKPYRPSVTSVNMGSSEVLEDPQGTYLKSSSSTPPCTVPMDLVAKNPQLCSQSLAETKDTRGRHTELRTPSFASHLGGSSANDDVGDTSSTLELIVDATCTKNRAYKKRHPIKVQRVAQPSRFSGAVDQQHHDLVVRQKRSEQRQRVISHLQAKAQMSRTDCKATAELHQITKGMQNMSITYGSSDVSMPSSRFGAIRPTSVDPSLQAQHINTYGTAVTCPTSMNDNVLFASQKSLFFPDPDTNAGKYLNETMSHNKLKEVGPITPAQEPSAGKYGEDIKPQSHLDQLVEGYVSREETERTCEMQDSRKHFLLGRMQQSSSDIPTVSSSSHQWNGGMINTPTGHIPAINHNMTKEEFLLSFHPQDDSPFSKATGHQGSGTGRFHPVEVLPVLQPLESDPSFTVVAPPAVLPGSAENDNIRPHPVPFQSATSKAESWPPANEEVNLSLPPSDAFNSNDTSEPTENDDNMDLYVPPSPRSSSPSDGALTNNPLSPSPQPSSETDFVEVDAGEVDGMEWQVIDEDTTGVKEKMSSASGWWKG